MSIIRSIPVLKVINGVQIRTSELAIVSEKEYKTTGEYAIVIRGVDSCKLKLDSTSTDKVKIKAMTTVLIIPDINSIDEEWDEISLEKGACVEFVFINQNWYILSSDGLKIW
jgi:hypothetical protein